MAESTSSGKRRRRAVKRSSAGDYDRTMDAPGAQPTSNSEEIRLVELDDDLSSEPLDGAEFYHNERPPHHGE